MSAFLAEVGPSTHTWFWFFGALFIVGAFLAVGGILRRSLSVIDRASRLIAVTGVVLALGGVGGAVGVAAAAPGTTFGVFKDMVGLATVTASPPPPSTTKPGAVTVRVTGKDFSFSPDSLHVHPGEKVTFQFVNQGPSMHTFTIPQLGVNLAANAGQTVTKSITVPKAGGSYPFLCTVPGHAQLGMKGTLTVGG